MSRIYTEKLCIIQGCRARHRRLRGSCTVDIFCPHSFMFYQTVFRTQEFLKICIFRFLLHRQWAMFNENSLTSVYVIFYRIIYFLLFCNECHLLPGYMPYPFFL
jgi:hypothetical protein